MASTRRVDLLRFQLQVAQLKTNIGGRIQELRVERKRRDPKWTQDYLAREIDPKLTGTQVSRWERGEVRPSDRRLERLAEIFNVTVADLLAGPLDGRAPTSTSLEEIEQLSELDPETRERMMTHIRNSITAVTQSRDGLIEMLEQLQLADEMAQRRGDTDIIDETRDQLAEYVAAAADEELPSGSETARERPDASRSEGEAA